MLWPSRVTRRKARQSALRRGLAVVGKVFALAALVAALALTLGLVLINTPLGRNAIKEQVTAALGPVFRGKWTLQEVDWIGFGAVGGVDAVFRDEAGRAVLRVQDVEARIAVWSTVASLLVGESDIELHFTLARIGHAEVLLDVDQDGLPFLARAFEPAPSADRESGQDSAPPAEGASRGVHLQFPRADIQHAWVHGQLDALPHLDVDLLDVGGAVEVTTGAVTVRVLQVKLHERALWQGTPLKGMAAVSLDIPVVDQEAMRLGASFQGAWGALPLASVATLKGNELYVAAALDRTSERDMRELLPSFPLHAPLSAGLEAKGTLPALKLDAYIETGVSRAAVVGSMNVDDPIKVDLDVRVRDFDLRTLGPNLPQSQFDAVLEARGQIDQGVAGAVTIAVAAGQIANVQLPPIRAQAEFFNETATLAGSMNDGSSSATFRIRGRSEGEEYVTDFNLVASSDDLSRYGEFVPSLSGKMRLSGEGALRLSERSTADLAVLARAEQLHVAGAEVASGTACVHVLGALKDPELTLEVSAEQLVYQRQHIAKAAVLARGSLSELRVRLSLEGAEDRPSLYGDTRIGLKADAVDFIEPHLTVWRKRGALDLRAERVRVGNAETSIKRGIVEGAGNRLQFEGRMGKALLSFRAQGRSLRLRDFAHVLGRDARTEGLLDVDVDLVASPTRALGKLDLALEQADIDKIGKGSMHAKLILQERRLAGTIVGDVGPYHVRLQADDVRLAGPVQVARSWRDAIGTVALEADIDLGQLKAMLPERSFPFDIMTGSLEASGKIGRTQAGMQPELDARMKTRGFQLSRKGDEQPRFDGKIVQGPPKWKLEGVDFEVATRIGSNGETDFKGRAWDRQGTIVALTFDADVPYRAWVANPKTVLRRLSDLPVHAKITVPRRKMDTLPPPLRIKGMAGEAEVQLDFKQEQGVPTLAVFVGVQRLQFQERADAIPITAEARGQYHGDRGKLEVRLACADQPTLTANAEISGDLSQLIRGEMSTLNWRAVNHVDAVRFPLQAIPVLAERRVDGLLSGTAYLELASDAKPQFDGELTFDKLMIADVRYASGHGTARLDEDSLRAAVKLEQRDGGFLTGVARMVRTPDVRALRKNGEVVPTFASATIDAKVTRFRASALQPFLQGTVAQLDGLLDGHVKLSVDDHQSALGGSLQLRQGTLQLETFGEELHGVEGKILFHPNGMIVLENARARGVSGKVEATGRAKLKGLSLAEAHATVNIPKRKPLPVVIEGEAMAEAWANLDLDIARRGNSTHAMVSIRKAGIRIPDKSAHDLQALGPPSEIRVGVQRTPEQFVILPEVDDDVAEPTAEAEPVRIILDLNNVEVRRGTTLRTRLDGQLTVTAGRSNDVRGQIRLSKGSLDVEGKRFEIERGVVTFVGDPSNPQVVLIAGWTAPEGTRVYADFTGPLKTGKVVLRAEPARTQSEILSLILFGTTDGQAVPVNSSQQSSEPGAGGAALGVAGGIATQGINRALDDMTGLDITTRVDTADSSNPRPELQVQIAQDIALSIAHVLGTPSAAEGLDRNFLTLDWRFLRNWSLETTFGDRGSVVMDAVWQLQY